MSYTEHHELADAHAHHGPRTLPAVLTAPVELNGLRIKLLIVAVVAAIVSVAFAFGPLGFDHIIRAYVLGFMISFGFAGGGLALLMLQYVSGGKWGLLIRRPLEAMTRTLPLVALMFIPVWAFKGHLYQWARWPDAASRLQAYHDHLMTQEQMLTANSKQAMLSPFSWTVQAIVVFAILGTFAFFLNKWSLERDADPAAGTQRSFNYWQIKLENISGIGILIYVICLTCASIGWIKSMDVTWASSIYGLQFLVGQGYQVLALSILSVILLSRFEPFKTLLRTTEQHDLGKFAFAFTMLNIYLTFAEFLIIWSGNVADEVPWYLARIHGGWWTICSLDFICHWVIPFTFLLSRDLKRNKSKMIKLTCWMIFARCLDMFWLIEPNFRDAAGNLHISGNIGILAYITVPIAVLSAWGAYYLTQLMSRPLINTNDPHLVEMLEPEHAH